MRLQFIDYVHSFAFSVALKHFEAQENFLTQAQELFLQDLKGCIGIFMVIAAFKGLKVRFAWADLDSFPDITYPPPPPALPTSSPAIHKL